jgi:hypothetical protein
MQFHDCFKALEPVYYTAIKKSKSLTESGLPVNTQSHTRHPSPAAAQRRKVPQHSAGGPPKSSS